MQSSIEGVAGTSGEQPTRVVSWGWFMKRALLGVAILVVATGSLAWLTYASIDPSLDTEQNRLAEPSAERVPVAEFH